MESKNRLAKIVQILEFTSKEDDKTFFKRKVENGLVCKNSKKMHHAIFSKLMLKLTKSKQFS